MSNIFYISESAELREGFNKLGHQLVMSQNITEVDNNEVEKLRDHFTCHTFKRNPEDIYSETYLDFFLKYGLSNLLKNYYIISEMKALGLFSSNNSILDLGSGPGTFELALLSFFNKNKSFSNLNFDITLQDCSNEFLQLFTFLWKDIPQCKKSGLNIKLKNELFTGIIKKDLKSPSIIIMSNSLAEMLRDKRFSTEHFIASLKEIKPILVIIDYGYDNFNDIFSKLTSKIEDFYDEISLYTWPKWNSKFKEIDLGYSLNYSCGMKTELSSNFRFIKNIYIPKEDSNNYRPVFYAEIVLMYKKSWENHNLDLLNDLFTDDATYVISESKAPLIGINSIKKYWHDNSLEQDSVTFFPQYISHDINIIHCNWISIFYRKDKKKWMLLKGNFDAHLKINKISYFKEEFEKHIFDRKPSFLNKDIIFESELCF